MGWKAILNINMSKTCSYNIKNMRIYSWFLILRRLDKIKKNMQVILL
jgi:hypothetical protein